KISSTGTYSLFLKSDGSLWGMGQNYYGQLGIGVFSTNSPEGTNRPVMIEPGGVTTISGGLATSLFITTDGSLWGTGDNLYGQLGIGYFSTNFPYGTNRPVLVTNGVVAISASDSSLFLKADGSLWGMGYNFYGQLGDGTDTNRNLPEQILSGGVTAISAGANDGLFLKSDGSLWAMGNNQYGQLGIGTFSTNSPYGTNEPAMVTNGVVAAACGLDFGLFLKNDGSLWAMGENNVGQLGDGTKSNRSLPVLIVTNGVTSIAAGSSHTLFLKSDGSLWGTGYNLFGQLGDGTTNSMVTPEMIVTNGVTAIAAASNHSLFVKSDGSLWAMGENTFGELGDGTFNNTNRPVQILAGVPSSYDRLSGLLLNDGDVQLSFVGLTGTNYALERTFNLQPPDWIPQATNPAGPLGQLLFTNMPDPATNNFWRIRLVP
ncbi:MAG: hypothetical protein ABSE48_21205, partial [Verrucomicrobiota bacterium]